MSHEHETYSDALASLHDQISFKNAGTSREERIEIMRAAADGLARVPFAQRGEIEYLIGLLPTKFDLHVFRAGGENEMQVAATIHKDTEDPPLVWRGYGETLADCLEQVIGTIAFRAAKNVPPKLEVETNRGGRGDPVVVGGIEYPTKKQAVCTLLGDPTYRAMTNDQLAVVVGCSEAYVMQLRSEQ